MHRFGNKQVLEAAPEVQLKNTSYDNPSKSIAIRVNRFGRLSIMLTAFVTTGTLGVSSTPAIAVTHDGLHKAHPGAAVPGSKPAHAAKPGLDKRTRVHSRQVSNDMHHPTRARHDAATRHHSPSRLASVRHEHGDTRNAEAVHRDAVPLANTTWDNPEVPSAVLDAIQSAARESGVDSYLLAAIAWRESRFNPNARSHQSSAKGLLQFTSGTWLQMVRDYGSQHNVANFAAAIHTTRSGDLVVTKKQTRDAILQLRNDPILSAKLAAQNMIRQRAIMQGHLKRRVRPADLYLIHVLGPTGAARFLTAVVKHPTASSLDIASLTVMRNAGLLARDGKPLTVANTYVATQRMLNSQRTHAAPMLAVAPILAVAKAVDSIEPATPIQISEAP